MHCSISNKFKALGIESNSLITFTSRMKLKFRRDIKALMNGNYQESFHTMKKLILVEIDLI